jgi:FAD dependent oxidoreductase
MIPVQLDNVIIAGKAYSVTHDALAVARMQRDLCVMGMVAAEAVRLAVNQKTLLRNIPIQELQRILISKKMLKESDLASDDYGFGCTPEEMARQVASAPDMDSALAGSAMLCLIPKEKALAAVEPYAASPNPAMHRLLCFLGHPKGVAQYLSSVEAALGENPLSKELFGGSATSHNLPDQGYAPVSALMLGALAAARETRVLTLLQKLAEKVNLEADELRSGWGYLYILAFGWERLASAQGVAGLKRVLGGALLQNRVVERTGDLRKCQAYVPERYAYLRMALSRALLRCGDPQGALELCAFLNEARVCFARAARAELVAAFGKDCGFDVGQWKQQIQEGGKKLKANPRTDSFL